MCGRYQSSKPPEMIQRWFGTSGALPNFEPRWNVAPTTTRPVVRWNPETKERSLDLLRWGLVPHWAKDLKIGNSLINARAETVTTKPSFRSAFARRRCIVPADAFYEWKKTPEGKVPHMIAPADPEEIFGFAGLWENWQDPEGNWIRTYTIVTAEPNDLVRTIHNRMPVILPREAYGTWLDEVEAEPDELLALMQPYPAEKMRVQTVSTRINSVRNDGADLLNSA